MTGIYIKWSTGPGQGLVWLSGFVLIFGLLHVGRFSVYHYDVLSQDEIVPGLVKSVHKNNCPMSLDTLGSYNIFQPLALGRNQTDDEVATSLQVKSGGTWAPSICSPQIQVYVVIPFRNREEHLREFLRVIHPFLQTQNLSYTILVAEQSAGTPFNRAKLFNVGYQELKKQFGFLGCVIFHDVDLIPLDARNIYGCVQSPRVLHLSAHLDNFRFNLPYERLFGGAVAIEESIFEDVNGFSNQFYGWGGEDDDLANRLSSSGYSIIRYASSISRYTMLQHRKEVSSGHDRPYNPLLERKIDSSDGIRQIEYKVLSIVKKPLYTHIIVNL